jgi:hypothetical protein
MNRDRDERGRFKPGNRVGGRFTPNKQPKTAGRKPTLYKQVASKAKEVGEEMGRKEFYDIMLYLVTLTVSELKELAKKPDVPVWIIGVISALFGDIQSKNTKTLFSILDRCFGKPGYQTQTVIVNQSANKIENHINVNLNVLTKNEIIILNDILHREAELYDVADVVEQIDEMLDDKSTFTIDQINKLVESEITRIESEKLSRKEGKKQEKSTSIN